ncbi:50S ribosomal protein L35 [bacterium Unc6]|nr:50S ribosomal protein L35 [bacterium Unc6]
MKKLKTVKAAAKRFRITARGKIIHSRSGHRHLLISKNRKRKRKISGVKQISNVEKKRILSLLPY